MDDALRERVEALERAVTDGEHDLSAFANQADALDRLDALETQVAALDERADELEAATQALRGYVGNVRSVNTDIEQRADAALSKAETLERRLSVASADESTGGADRTESDSPAGSGTHQPRQTRTDSQQGRNGTDRPESPQETTGTTVRTARTDSDSRHTDGGHSQTAGQCDSCGRPRPGHETETPRSQAGDGHSEHSETGRTRSVSVSSDQRRTQRATGDPPDPTETSSAVTDSTTSEAGGLERGDRTVSETAAGVQGVPTVESLARDTDESVEADEDPGPFPDGDTDPLVGATEGTDDTGTLQRIRDLL